MPFMAPLVRAYAKVKANQGECDKGTKEFNGRFGRVVIAGEPPNGPE